MYCGCRKFQKNLAFGHKLAKIRKFLLFPLMCQKRIPPPPPPPAKGCLRLLRRRRQRERESPSPRGRAQNIFFMEFYLLIAKNLHSSNLPRPRSYLICSKKYNAGYAVFDQHTGAQESRGIVAFSALRSYSGNSN